MMWRVRTEAGYQRELQRLNDEEEALHKKVEAMTYQTLGMLTHAWAALEIILDTANWTIARHREKKERFPVSLSRKLAYFRAGHNANPKLAHLREEAASIADAITKASKTRHTLIHGFVRGSMRQDTLTLLIHWVPKGEDSHLLYSDEVKVERRELFALGDTIEQLGSRLAHHAARMLEALGDKPEDAPG
jgi:hypothetical protein